MTGKMYMFNGTMTKRKHPKLINGTSYPKDW